MACDFIFKGKQYTREELVSYINSNSQEFLELLSEPTEILVRTSEGVEMSVPRNSIVTYQTEVGTINYYKPSNGELIMLRDIDLIPIREEHLKEVQQFKEQLLTLDLTEAERLAISDIFEFNQDYSDA